MHDIDRTQLEMESDSFESEDFVFEEESEDYGEAEAESPFEEAEEMEFAAELMEVTDEAELDQFLGGLIKRAGRALGKVVKSPVGRALGGLLKNAARRALPIAGKALGSAFGGPLGGALGGKLASTAGQFFGLELEGLSPEDKEFETARQFVRLAGAAAKQAVLAPVTATPQTVAKKALIQASRKYAPGLIYAKGTIPSGSSYGHAGARTSGRWIRRGRRIILLGV